MNLLGLAKNEPCLYADVHKIDDVYRNLSDLSVQISFDADP